MATAEGEIFKLAVLMKCKSC